MRKWKLKNLIPPKTFVFPTDSLKSQSPLLFFGNLFPLQKEGERKICRSFYFKHKEIIHLFLLTQNNKLTSTQSKLRWKLTKLPERYIKFKSALDDIAFFLLIALVKHTQNKPIIQASDTYGYFWMESIWFKCKRTLKYYWKCQAISVLLQLWTNWRIEVKEDFPSDV